MSHIEYPPIFRTARRLRASTTPEEILEGSKAWVDDACRREAQRKRDRSEDAEIWKATQKDIHNGWMMALEEREALDARYGR